MDNIKNCFLNIIEDIADYSFQHYRENAKEKFSDFFKFALKNKDMTPSILVASILFYRNKKKYLNHKKHIINDIGSKILETDLRNLIKELVPSHAQKYFHLEDLNADNVKFLFKYQESGIYFNVFSGKPTIIEFNEKENSYCNVELYSLLYSENISKVSLNYLDMLDIYTRINHKISFDLMQKFILFHEIAHDSTVQLIKIINYNKLNFNLETNDIPQDLLRLQEVHSDLTSILYLIKNFDLNDIESSNLIDAIISFRNNSHYDKDNNFLYMNNDSNHIHSSQIELLILKNYIKNFGIEELKLKENLELTQIALFIAEQDYSYLKKMVLNDILPKKFDTLKNDLLENKFLLDSYKKLLSKVNIDNETIFKIIEHKLYSEHKEKFENFRIKFSFEYIENIKNKDINNIFKYNDICLFINGINKYIIEHKKKNKLNIK